MEQKDLEEYPMKFAAQKREKHQLYQQIIELEKKLDERQLLELEIEQMRGALEIMRHFPKGSDVEAKKKMESLEEILKKKEGSLEGLKCLTQALLVKESRSNDEVQDARKVLINILSARPNSEAFIGVKRMGELDHNLIVSAAKKKYPGDVAEEKAREFASQISEKLADPRWYPFKFTVVGADHKEVIDDEDGFIKALKNEWDGEVYDAVVTTLNEMNEYNPSGRTSVLELWNYKDGRRATLAECVKFIAKPWGEKKTMRT